ncbi:hypothetical protein D3C87_1366020 [compost metagenome]
MEQIGDHRRIGDDGKLINTGNLLGKLQRRSPEVDKQRVPGLDQFCRLNGNGLFVVFSQFSPLIKFQLKPKLSDNRPTMDFLDVFQLFKLIQISANGFLRNIKVISQFIDEHLPTIFQLIENDVPSF